MVKKGKLARICTTGLAVYMVLVGGLLTSSVKAQLVEPEMVAESAEVVSIGDSESSTDGTENIGVDGTWEAKDADAEDKAAEESSPATDSDVNEGKDIEKESAEELEEAVAETAKGTEESPSGNAVDSVDLENAADTADAVNAAAELTVENVSYTGYSELSLNVRSGPSTAFPSIGVLSIAEAVDVTGSCSNGWLRVDFHETTGYCSGKYISRIKPETVQSEEAEEASENPKRTAETTPETANLAGSTGIAECYGGASQEWANKINAELAYVPSNILNCFVSNGWHIYATGEDIAATYFPGVYNSVMGMTLPASKEIRVECRNSAMSAPVHEMGHFLDVMCGWPSKSSEFAEIYAEEAAAFKGQIPNSSCVRDEQEFFAETFYYLCKNPAKCTPRAVEYVSRYIGAV